MPKGNSEDSSHSGRVVVVVAVVWLLLFLSLFLLLLVSLGKPRCDHSSGVIRPRSILQRRYSLASSRQLGAFSLFTSFIHFRYLSIMSRHSPSWSNGKDPRSGGVGNNALIEFPGFPLIFVCLRVLSLSICMEECACVCVYVFVCVYVWNSPCVFLIYTFPCLSNLLFFFCSSQTESAAGEDAKRKKKKILTAKSSFFFFWFFT